MTKKAENVDIRRGPSPLPVHVGLAMTEYSRMQQAGNVSPQDMEKMLAGIKKYQQHPYKRNMESLPVIWQEGEVSIQYCAAENPVASLFLIPSLINKSFILDLLPEKSFTRWLAGQGVDVYLLDWGTPLRDPGLESMDALVANRLCPAIDAASDHAGRDLHGLGYCMGGTLLAAATMHRIEKLRSIIFLASPWDFAAGDKKLAGQVQQGTPAALQMIAQKGHLPMDWIQSVFAAVNADRAMKKFSEFMALDDDCEGAHLFVAVEDWLNDGVDMPGVLAKTCVLDWYGTNKPGKGAWTVDGKPMNLERLDMPALVVASLNDRLVPKESSMAMANLLPQAETLAPSSGHIGMMTGRNAQEQVWQPVLNWVREKA